MATRVQCNGCASSRELAPASINTGSTPADDKVQRKDVDCGSLSSDGAEAWKRINPEGRWRRGMYVGFDPTNAA